MKQYSRKLYLVISDVLKNYGIDYLKNELENNPIGIREVLTRWERYLLGTHELKKLPYNSRFFDYDTIISIVNNL